MLDGINVYAKIAEQEWTPNLKYNEAVITMKFIIR